MRKKKYNPVKVKDPQSDGHFIRLQPMQSFNITLTRVFSGDMHDVEVKSDYLVLEHVKHDTLEQQDTYCFSQKYDLTNWAEISNVFLGNIIIKRFNTTDKDTKIDVQRMCIVLETNDATKANVVTVINPEDHLVKIEPSQVMQVVIFDEHSRWTLLGVENVGMNCVRSETVYNDYLGVYDQAHLLCPEPRNVDLVINNNLTAAYSCVYQQEQCARLTRKIEKEYHFWTHLTVESLRKTNSMMNGSYSLGNMQFYARGEDGNTTKKRSFEVMMSLRGSGNKANVYQYQSLMYFGRNWNVRYCSADRTTLLCPNLSENIDMGGDRDCMYLEIPSPAVYFNCSDNLFWYGEFNMDSHYGMKVRELRKRHVNGHTIQRFAITNILKTTPPGELSFIGALRFLSKLGKGTDISLRSLTLSLWKVKKALCAERSSFKPPLHGASSSDICHYRPTTTHVGSKEIIQSNKRPIGWDVDLVQEKLESLADGTTFVKLISIDPDVKSSCGIDYYDDYLMEHIKNQSHHSGKKKRVQSQASISQTASTTFNDNNIVPGCRGLLEGKIEGDTKEVSSEMSRGGCAVPPTPTESYEEDETAGEKETWQDLDDWYRWFDLV